ncbi:hypothetical protein HF086_005644 [Spodoptera exigua]|uniref:Uncharacterized protein n=1 Tax=Spodoptera exigua TaxID=7107 RepID=A0A922MYC1_SPOEX|nr:hypothetical protein HF086_005644 [Spodoptera exigua]
MAGRKDSLRGLSSFKSRGHRLVGLVPPENTPSDIDSRSEPENEEEIAVYRTEELSSSPCPSIDSDIERMHILDSSHTSEDHISVNGSENNPVLEFEDNLNQAQPPLTPIINNVLPPTGEVNFNALPSLASLLSIPSSAASSIASPSIRIRIQIQQSG